MGILRYSKETFGYLVAFPDGRMGLYTHDVASYLKDNIRYEDLIKYKIKTLQLDTDFHLNAPLMVWIELTRKCNLRCKHCFMTGGEPLEHELCLQEILSLLDNLKKMNVLSLIISGGEPMLREDFDYILKYACGLGFVVSVATNGLLLTQERINRLPKTYEDLRISISLDGAGNYNSFRGKVSFKQVTDKLLLLKDNGILSAAMVTMSNKNIGELRKIFEWCIEHKIVFSSVQFSPIGRGGKGENRNFVLTRNDVEKASSLWLDETLFEIEMNKSIGICVAKILDYAFELVYSTKRCMGGRFLAYVCANGDVYPCSICASNNTFKTGNLRENNFSEIWLNSFREIRSFTWESFAECTSCMLSRPPYFCTSRCPSLGLRYKGNPHACGALPINKLILKKRTELLQQVLGSVNQ